MKCFLWATSLVAFLSAGQAFAGITPVISASRCTTPAASCPAPLAIHFSAVGTTCSTSECDDSPFANEAFHALSYEWDFGDSGAGTWAVSGQSKNVEYGPIAVHVFDSAGPHTVTLDVHSGSESNTGTTLTIYVDDPDTVFSTTTRCISNNTDHTSCPSGATRVDNETDFDSAMSAALSAGNRRILFHANHTFDVSANTFITLDGPGIVGSYGTGNGGRAIIDMTTCVNQDCRLIQPGQGGNSDVTEDWRFMDLEVLAGDPPGTPGDHCASAFTCSSAGKSFEDTLWYKIEKIGGNNFVQSLRPGAYPNNESPIGLFIVDNVAATHVYIVFSPIRQGGVVGNIFGDDSMITYEHHLRTSRGRWKEYVIAHNEFKGKSCRDTTIRACDRDDPGLCPDGPDYSQYLVFRENTHRWINTDDSPCTPTQASPLSVYPSNDSSDERMGDIIIENNRFETYLYSLAAKTVTVRNNLFAMDTATKVPGGNAIQINASHSDVLPTGWADDIMIYNNSGYNYSGAATEHMIRPLSGGGPTAKLPSSWYVRNNVWWDTTGSAEVYYCDDGAESWCNNGTVSNNIDSDDLNSSPFASNRPDPDVISDWYLTGPSASVAAGAGFALPSIVRLDFEHGVRPGGDAQWSIGALEADASRAPPSPGGPPPPPVLLDP